MRFHEHHFSGTGLTRPASIPTVLGINDQHWMADALCAQTDPEAFFPEKGGSTREAKAVCLRCDVRADCLDYALANQERHGIWGGLSQKQLRKLDPDQPTEGTTAA